MREEEKTLTTCSALFADFIHNLKQNPSTSAALPSSAVMGVAAAGAVTPEEEVVVEVDLAAGAAMEAQAKADPQTNLSSTRSLGFRPISTTP